MADQPVTLPALKGSVIGILLFFAFLAAPLSSLMAQPMPQGVKITDLRQKGWEIVDKKAFDDWQEGIAPYVDIPRLVYRVVYTLQKAEKTMTCTLTRDVMYDTSEHMCVEGK